MTTSRPLIGLTGRRKRGAEVAGFLANLADVDIDVYVNLYARAITEAGGLPVHLPLHVDPADYAGRLDGILLSGGTDVDPARYGAAPDPAAYVPEPARDRLELGFVDLAVSEELPVLGVCRGLQVLNVWGGGTLHQHVPAHARFDAAADARVEERDDRAGQPAPRPVRADARRQLAPPPDRRPGRRRMGGRRPQQRRRHVEALEWPGHDVVAVQWHPELLDTRASDPIFAWLVDRAARRTSARQPARS